MVWSLNALGDEAGSRWIRSNWMSVIWSLQISLTKATVVHLVLVLYQWDLVILDLKGTLTV